MAIIKLKKLTNFVARTAILCNVVPKGITSSCTTLGAFDGEVVDNEPLLLATKAEHINKPPARGCIAVYVGMERQRRIIPIKYLRHELFDLLQEGDEEYEHANTGALHFPCDPDLFDQKLSEIRKHDS